MTKVVVAGMPESGKTTFIAALTHLLNAQQIRTRLKLERLSGEEGHLAQLETHWVNVAAFDRTRVSAEQWVTFHVCDSEDGMQSDLHVPDLRGELFEQPAAMGRCQRVLWDALIESEGLLLFTNADRAEDGILIEDVNEVLLALEQAEVEETLEPSSMSSQNSMPKVAAKNFNPSDMPEEAKSVELLQAMNRQPISRKHRKLAIVISAWDVICARAHITPETWFAQNRPMLHQFLIHNSDQWDMRIYGVSAQGGQIPKHKKSLEEMDIPSKRIKIEGGDVPEHDLTAIIHWLALPTELTNAT